MLKFLTRMIVALGLIASLSACGEIKVVQVPYTAPNKLVLPLDTPYKYVTMTRWDYYALPYSPFFSGNYQGTTGKRMVITSHLSSRGSHTSAHTTERRAPRPRPGRQYECRTALDLHPGSRTLLCIDPRDINGFAEPDLMVFCYRKTDQSYHRHIYEFCEQRPEQVRYLPHRLRHEYDYPHYTREWTRDEGVHYKPKY